MRRRPRRPRSGGNLSKSGRSMVPSATFAAVTAQPGGVPSGSVRRCCLLPLLPRSVGFGPVASPLLSPADWSSRR